MTSFAQLRDESNQAGVGFLLAELDTALVFMDVAETTGSQENRERNIANARLAYDTVQRMRDRVILDTGQLELFGQKLTILRQKLGIDEPISSDAV